MARSPLVAVGACSGEHCSLLQTVASLCLLVTVAAKHFPQVTDDHFEEAVRLRVQQPAVLPRTVSQAGLAEEEKTPVLQGDASGCDHLRDGQVPPAGIEPATYGLGNRRSIP